MTLNSDAAVMSNKLKCLGKVYLVGAGPGDPGLMTLKGKTLLECADVVVYDALVSAPILAMINPNAEQISAGKRRGRHSMVQEEITQVLVDKAKTAAIVVRLKGGDPFVFGRGGEEMQDLGKSRGSRRGDSRSDFWHCGSCLCWHSADSSVL